MAEQASLHGHGLGGKANYINGQRAVVGAGPATAADRAAGQEELWGEPGDLRLPPGFLVAGQFGHVGEMLADSGIGLVEFWKQLVAEAVAGVGRILVGGVFAPGLAEAGEVSLNLGASGGE